MREHLESVQRQTGGTPQPLASAVELPEDADYLWQWFHRLSSRRQIGMAACPISWTQIESFFRIIGIRPDEWEIAAIELLDNAWMASAAKSRQDK